MNDEEQILISAYVDGEATSEESVRAERLLVEDASARAYREELLSMSASLQALPRQRLPRDFAEQVLGAAEREMFVGKPWPDEQIIAAISSRERWLRRLAYAGATVAAAILLTLFLPTGELPVALDEDKQAAQPNSEPNRTQTAKSDRHRKALHEEDAQIGAQGSGSPRDESTPFGGLPVDELSNRSPGESAEEDAPSAHLEESAEQKMDDKLLSLRSDESPLLVVSVDMADTSRLQRLLSANQIESHARGERSATLNKDLRRAEAKENQKQLQELDASQASPTVYAEMTRSQLDAVVAQMKTAPDASTVAIYSQATTGKRPEQAEQRAGSKKGKNESPHADATKVRRGSELADEKATALHDDKNSVKEGAGGEKYKQEQPAASDSPPAGQFADAQKGSAEGAVQGSRQATHIKPAELVRVLFVLRANSKNAESAPAAKNAPAASAEQ